MTSKLTQAGLAAAAALAIVAGAEARQAPAPAGAPTKQDHVAALKQSLQDGQAKIRQYEWVETTIISLKGEEKARKQNRCYYGADGKVQKVPIADAAGAEPPAAGGGGGRRGRRGAGIAKEKIVENKKEEMSDYMKKAVALVHQYVPPSPEKIQAAKDAGHVAMKPQAGGAARVAISDYLQKGDAFNIDLDPTANRLLALSVDSYLDDPDDKVTLVVQMATLPDGALYAGQTTLDATAKNIKVVIQNSGHRPMAR